MRIALIVATLLSLCASNNVGLSFLPLPVVTDPVAAERLDSQQSNASRAPSSIEPDTLRVPMLAQSQKRADKDQTTQTFVATLNAGFVLLDEPRIVRVSIDLISLVTTAFAMRPPGRAPSLNPV